METVMVNKGNWSGETVPMKVDRKTGQFEVHGYHFRMEILPEENGFQEAVVYGAEWGAEPFMHGCRYKGMWTFLNCGIDRDHIDPYVAAMQVLFNTL